MKSRSLFLVMLLAVLPALSASAQVLPLGQVPSDTAIQRTSCDSCIGGCNGGCGTVWGSQCDIHPGLFPPCPNPCKTTLLADLVGDVKMAVDTSLSNLFCCVLGMGHKLACGCVDACNCGAASYGCGAAAYGPGGCDCAECMGGGTPMMGEPVPAYSTPAGQPTPVQTPSAGPTQADPFSDDPQPAAQPIPSGSTSRNMTPARRPRAVTQRQPVRQRRQSQVQRASHQQVATPQRIESRSAGARPIVGAQNHYRPRRNASIRTANGRQLQKTPIKSTAPQSSLRFR